MRTRITILAALACAGLMATPAVAGSGGSYKGKTSQGPPVTFKVSHGKVKKFVGGVNVLCLGGYGIEFRAAIPPTAMKLRHGKFSYKGRDASDEANIKIKGELTGKKVTGKVEMTDTFYSVSDQFIYTCVGSGKFTAKRK